MCRHFLLRRHIIQPSSLFTYITVRVINGQVARHSVHRRCRRSFTISSENRPRSLLYHVFRCPFTTVVGFLFTCFAAFPLRFPSLFLHHHILPSFLPSFLCLLISFLHSLLPSLLLFRPLFCTAIPYIYCICSDEVCVGYNDSRSSSLRARPAASQRAQSKVLCWICTHRTIQDSSSSSVIVIVVLE